MTVGELFLNIGVKGTEKTVGALTNVKKGLSETAHLSLEAKAGIIGAMYALEQLFATSGKAGTDLTNFNATLGVSAQTLQQYQYAARQVGVSNQEVEGSFKALQGSITKTLMGEGAPKGLARVSLLTGGISQKDLEQYAKQPQLLVQKLQEYAKKEQNIGLRNETLKSFGLGENMIAALSRNAFRPEVLKKAPTYSDKEVGALDKANIAWSNLGNKIQMAVGHFNAMHGGQLVNDISKIVTQVFKLIEVLITLADKLKVFAGIAKIFQVTAGGLGLVAQGADAVLKDKKGVLHGIGSESQKILAGAQTSLKASVGGVLGKISLPSQASLGGVLGKIALPSVFSNAQAAVPPRVPAGTGAKTQTQNNNVTVTNNFQHPGVDHKKTASSVKQAIQHAYRQMQPQAQGN